MSRMIQGSFCDDQNCPRDYQFEAMQRALSGKDRFHWPEPDCGKSKEIEPAPVVTFGLDGMDNPGNYFTDGQRTADEGMEELSRWADEQLAGHDDKSDVFDDLF